MNRRTLSTHTRMVCRGDGQLAHAKAELDLCSVVARASLYGILVATACIHVFVARVWAAATMILPPARAIMSRTCALAFTKASLFVLGSWGAAADVAFAQAAITGSVRDASGAVMPDVIVEARSPALIEKSRTTLTDDSGRYRIEDLRPGIYRVRFSRQGWQPYEATGIELVGSRTVRIDAMLVLDGLTSDVDVFARAIDVHGTHREISLSGETVRLLPTARTYNALLVLVPGVVTSTNDIVMEAATTSFPIHGGRATEGRLELDGLTVGSPPSGNSATTYALMVAYAQEVTFTTSSVLGETETGGLVMRIVPRSGGNTTRGSLFASGSGSRLQDDNLTTTLREQGIRVAPFSKVYDVSAVLGGPVVKDRLWYVAGGHVGGSRRDSTNVYDNLNAADASRWLYAPDLDRRAYSDRMFESANARVTWQVSPRNRLGAFWDVQALCRTCTGATPGLSEPQRVSPEAVGVLGRRLDVVQVTWWSPISSRIAVDAAFGSTSFGVGNFEREPNPTRSLIRVMEQCATGCAANGNIPGLVYRSQDFSDAHTGSYTWKASSALVTGTHSVKLGYQHTFMIDDRTWMTNDQNLTYRFNNGAPNQLTQSISPWINNTRVAWWALFAQGQWTRNRLTLQGAVRFDKARSWFPRQQLGPSRFLPAAIVIPETRGVDSYKDISPRIGLALDVFGDGRTAVKASLGRFLDGAGTSGLYAATNPTLRMPQTTPAFGTAGVTRAWIDANANYAPDCNLLDPAAQDLRETGGDLCGVMSNTSFGRDMRTSTFDPAIVSGWGVRPSDWQLAAWIEQALGARASLSLTYTRRWFQGFFAVDNLSLEPPDLTPFSLIAPADPRLPGGGGYLVTGLYDVVPEKAGQVDNFIANSSKYGSWTQYFNGVDLTLNIRAAKALVVAAGTSTGQTVADNCGVRQNLPELSTNSMGTSAFGAGLSSSVVNPGNPYCHVAFGILTQLRGFSTYIVPRLDIVVSATFQSKPGPLLAANYAAPNATIAPRLGRNLSANAANMTVNLVKPGTMYGDRINQLDLRVARTFKTGRASTTLGIDVYNALNSGTVLTYNNTFVPGGPWLQPLTLLSPRFLKLTGEIDF